jgi:guanine deaminase
MEVIRTNCLSPVTDNEVLFLPDHYIMIEDGRILNINPNIPVELEQHVVDATDCVCIPGLIDLHVHLSQWFARGKYKPDLIEWLETYIYSEEVKFKDPIYARYVAEKFFQALISNGTTCAVIYVAAFKEACDQAFQVAEEYGYRCIMGKTMMDVNCPDEIREDTETSMKESIELYEKWDNKTHLLNYVFTPRFAPVCSPKLLRKIGSFAKFNNAYIQSHLSENLNELDWVHKLYPEFRNYTDVYAQTDILGPKTIMAHCIHLQDDEIEMLKKTNTRVAHCPDSNFYLKSGMFPHHKLKKSNIQVGLGSDVGAGTSLNMFYHMKMANFRQKTDVILPAEAFYLATLGGAKALHKDHLIGSIEVGKSADLTFVTLESAKEKTASEIVSELVFTGMEKQIKLVYINGVKKYPFDTKY